MSNSDFSISSLSKVDLISECKILDVPQKIMKSGDTTKIGQYLLDHNLLAQVQSDLGIAPSQPSPPSQSGPPSGTNSDKPAVFGISQGQQYNSIA